MRWSLALSTWWLLQSVEQWGRSNLAGADPRYAWTLIIWLMKNRDRSSSVGDLYREVQISESTMRPVVRAFVAAGLAEIEVDPADNRRQLIRGTDKLDDLAQDYADMLRGARDPDEQDG
jgi:hypothetical protein